MTELLIFLIGLFALLLIIGIFTMIAAMFAMMGRVLYPAWNRKWLAFFASGMAPLSMFVLFIAALMDTLDPSSRGPEVLGLAILGSVAFLVVFIVWPPSFWLTYRVFRIKPEPQ